MNIRPPEMLAVPKPEYCWPLIVVSAAGPCWVLRLESALSTVLKSPVAELLAWSSTVPTATWLPVWAPAAKAPFDWNSNR